MDDLPSVLRRTRLPVIGSPMFIVSTPELVIAQCKAGIIGSLPALNARSASQLADWLSQIVAELREHDTRHPDRPAAPFAVNQIVHRSNSRLEQDMALCLEYEVPLLITSLGAREDVNAAARDGGAVVMHDVTDNRFAQKAIEKGAHGLIAVAAGAGGHAGTRSPFALVSVIRQWFSGPLALSGSIASGNAILAAQVLGADFAYVGSVFIATVEANARDEYKRAIVDGTSDDIVYSDHFTGVHGNYLASSIRAAGLDVDELKVGRVPKMDWGTVEAKAWRDIWGSGQGIGAVDSVVSVRALVERLEREYENALDSRSLDGRF